MIKKHFYLFFVLISGALGAQPALTLDWQERRPDTEGYSVKHDSNNNVIVCGRSYNSFNFWSDIIITKHSKAGILLWDTVYTDLFGGVVLPQAMAIDSANNIYIAGLTHGGISNGNTEGFMLKFTPQGVLDWERFYGWNDSLFGGFRNFKIQDNQYIYITGKMAPMYWNGPAATILVKYDLAGNELWSHIDSVAYPEEGVTVEFDKAKNVYLTGTTSCCPPYSKSFVSKYDSSGNKKWQTELIDSFYVEGYARCSAIDDSANIYIGYDVAALGFATHYDGGYAKIDSSGTLKWLTAYDNFQNTNSNEFIFGINFDKSNNSYLYGYTSQSGFSSQGYLAKYDSRGQMKWSFVPDTINFPYGFVLITVSFYNDSTILGLGNRCLFSLDTSGTLNWSVLGLPSVNYHVNRGEIYDSTLAITGYNHPDLSIEDSMVVTQINFDVLTGTIKNGSKNNSNLFVYPNPFNERLTISNMTRTKQETFVRLVNTFGEVIYQTNTSESNIEIPGNKLLPGIYFLELIIGEKRNTLKVIKL